MTDYPSVGVDSEQPPYMIALGKMVWDSTDAVELGTLIDAASFPDRSSRHLFIILAREGPKGTSPSAFLAQENARLP